VKAHCLRSAHASRYSAPCAADLPTHPWTPHQTPTIDTSSPHPAPAPPVAQGPHHRPPPSHCAAVHCLRRIPRPPSLAHARVKETNRCHPTPNTARRNPALDQFAALRVQPSPSLEASSPAACCTSGCDCAVCSQVSQRPPAASFLPSFLPSLLPSIAPPSQPPLQPAPQRIAQTDAAALCHRFAALVVRTTSSTVPGCSTTGYLPVRHTHATNLQSAQHSLRRFTDILHCRPNLYARHEPPPDLAAKVPNRLSAALTSLHLLSRSIPLGLWSLRSPQSRDSRKCSNIVGYRRNASGKPPSQKNALCMRDRD
jgi:hypothetical protein